MTTNSSYHEQAALRGTDGPGYRVLSDLSEVSQISHEWDRLLADSSCNRAFGSAEWYIASCRLHSSSSTYLVVATRETEIVGILPLVLNPEDGVARFPHYMTDYNDIIARGDNPSLAADLLSYALLSVGRCKKVVLTRLRQDSNCVKAAPFVAANPNIALDHREIHAYRYIRLPRSFDEYLASRSKAFKKSIRRAEHRIENSCLTIRELPPDDFDAARLAELSISLAIARQKEESFFWQPQAQSFVREVFPIIFHKRGLRAFAILEGERVIALNLCMAKSNSLGYWNGGFLAEAECWSPGRILFAFGIKQSIDMKLEEFDFMLGQEAYKASWANSSYAVSEMQLTAKGGCVG
jgi:CelD/BcsL family acetyltransferase involved in cellulose biosynthesis